MSAPVIIKKDPVLLAFVAFCVVATFGLVYTRHITWQEAVAFLTGALAVPSLLGAKEGGAP